MNKRYAEAITSNNWKARRELYEELLDQLPGYDAHLLCNANLPAEIEECLAKMETYDRRLKSLLTAFIEIVEKLTGATNE